MNKQEKRDMNISDMKKDQGEYEKYLKENPFQIGIEKIARDIREREDNAVAMEFTRTILDLLKENGVSVHCTKHKFMEEVSKNSIKEKYGVIFDSMDFSEHDKEFTNEIEILKENLQHKETTINQIDDILNELFGVTHDMAKPDEFKKILKEKIGDAIEQVEIIINGATKTYTIEEIKSIIKTHEDIKYCNEHRGEHLHAEECLKIMSLNSENARLQSLVDKYKKSFEEAKKERDCQICEYQKKIDDLENRTIADFLPTEPIKVADMLINAKRIYETSLEGEIIYKDERKMFDISGLKQIASHILTYCHANERK